MTTIGRLRSDGQPDQFHHQRETRARRGGQRRRAAERAADDHVDRRKFIFRLHQHAADLFQVGRQPFQDLGRGGDRVGRNEADAAADAAEPGRLVAADVPAGGNGGGRGSQPAGGRLHAGDQRHAGTDTGEAGVKHLLSALFQPLGDDGADHVFRQPGQAGEQAQAQHVHPAAGQVLHRFLQRQRHQPCLRRGDARRRFAPVRIAQHQACPVQDDLAGETLDVQPVERHHQVEAVVQAFDRAGADAQERRHLAAADLRTRRARHQPIEAGLGGSLEQHLGGGHHPGTPAPVIAIDTVSPDTKPSTFPT